MFDVCVSLPFIPTHSSFNPIQSHSFPFIPIHSHSFPFPFLFNLNCVCCVQEPPPAVGQAPDLMTNPQMAALVAPIDAAVLFPFYGEVNITNAKFRWYKTGHLEKKSKSFYAVRSAPLLFTFACFLLVIAAWHRSIIPMYLWHICCSERS